MTMRDRLTAIDEEFSKRTLNLDPAGYFTISIDRDAGLIRARHYSNTIDSRGLAIDPKTGKPIPAKGSVKREPTLTVTGRTAKEICIKLFEEVRPCPVSLMSHAAYLGREFARAEQALVSDQDYLQD